MRSMIVVAVVALMTVSQVRAEGLKSFSIKPGQGEIAWTGEFQFQDSVTEADLQALRQLVDRLARHGGPNSVNKSTFTSFGEVTWRREGKRATASAKVLGEAVDQTGRVFRIGNGVPFLREWKVDGPKGARTVTLKVGEGAPLSYIPHATDVVLRRLGEDLFTFEEYQRDFVEEFEMDASKSVGGVLVFRQHQSAD